MEKRLTVLIADDHAIVREGLKTLVAAQADMTIAAEAADGGAALELATQLMPDVAVLDISMPGLRGIACTRELRESSPATKVVTLTVHEDRSYLRQAFEAGASGYVLKRSAAAELVRAIRVVAAGGTYIDPAVAGRLVEAERGGDSGNVTIRLSEREEEVLRLIALGHSNKEIARLLNVSVKTIETYKLRSFEKLGLQSRVELLRLAMARGWLDNV
jgi:two-component system, NarL family, response regulator NreC